MTLFRQIVSPGEKGTRAAAGFSLVELLVVAAILMVVLGGVMSYITLALQRSKTEQTKVDLTQEGRSFVDEFERDIHQSGYPNCRMFNYTGSTCSAHFSDSTLAVGLASVSSTQVVFEGDVDGDGNVDSVQYRLLDSAGNFPPTGTCPCTIQRSQMTKVNGTAPLAQATNFSQELQQVVNSGNPAGGALYGGGLPISGNVLFGGGAITNTAYYAAVTTFKDFPVFSAYDQNGTIVTLPRVITTPADQPVLACGSSGASCITSIRLTINLLGSGASGYDPKTMVRPVVTLVGNGRINN
jgi:type II secretory pathway pseudopilin PulG